MRNVQAGSVWLAVPCWGAVRCPLKPVVDQVVTGVTVGEMCARMARPERVRPECWLVYRYHGDIRSLALVDCWSSCAEPSLREFAFIWAAHLAVPAATLIDKALVVVDDDTCDLAEEGNHV